MWLARLGSVDKEKENRNRSVMKGPDLGRIQLLRNKSEQCSKEERSSAVANVRMRVSAIDANVCRSYCSMITLNRFTFWAVAPGLQTTNRNVLSLSASVLLPHAWG
ncbi:hypothetical protein WAI453_009658 [Rhynchosporium graminicola]